MSKKGRKRWERERGSGGVSEREGGREGEGTEIDTI